MSGQSAAERARLLTPWGWSPAEELRLVAHLEQRAAPDFQFDRIGRVIEVQRKLFRVQFGDQDLNLTARAALRTAPRFPIIGDWVFVKDEVIVELVPPRNEVSRLAAGESGDVQYLASFVDVVFVICAVDQGVNLNKIERLALGAKQSGATVQVIITKADLFTPEQQAEATQNILARLGQNAKVILTSVKTSAGLDAICSDLQALRRANPIESQRIQTALLIGSSGAGKSSLVNALFRSGLQLTGDVRTDDAKGRHTTTSRRAFLLSEIGVIIDSPGMRELKLPSGESGGYEDALLDQFADIEDLGLTCKFTSCTHQTEPGCQVRAAVKSGLLSEARLLNYKKMKHEIRRQSAHTRDQAKRPFGKKPQPK